MMKFAHLGVVSQILHNTPLSWILNNLGMEQLDRINTAPPQKFGWKMSIEFMSGHGDDTMSGFGVIGGIEEGWIGEFEGGRY